MILETYQSDVPQVVIISRLNIVCMMQQILFSFKGTLDATRYKCKYAVKVTETCHFFFLNTFSYFVRRDSSFTLSTIFVKQLFLVFYLIAAFDLLLSLASRQFCAKTHFFSLFFWFLKLIVIIEVLNYLGKKKRKLFGFQFREFPTGGEWRVTVEKKKYLKMSRGIFFYFIFCDEEPHH